MTGKHVPIWGHAKAAKESVVGLFRGQQESCFFQEQTKGREAGVNDVGTGVLGACGGWTRNHLKVLSREEV